MLNFFSKFFREMYFSEGTTFQKYIQFSLIPFVPIYKLARNTHKYYRNSIKQELSKPVISVGNISLGGTGKTPYVLRLVSWFLDQNVKPAVLKRGEGNRRGVVLSGQRTESIDEIAQSYGDEVALLRSKYPNVPVGISKNRITIGEKIEQNCEIDLFILDDGFQYTCLERDLDIVLLGERKEYQNWQLPAGPLRDHPKTLKNADIISIKTHDFTNFTLDEARYNLNSYAKKNTAILKHKYEFLGVFKGSKNITDQLQSEPSELFTTQARPAQIEIFLNKHGIQPKEHHRLPDHGSIDWSQIQDYAQSGNVMMTEKEWVKIPPEKRGEIAVIRSKLRIEPYEDMQDVLTNFSGD